MADKLMEATPLLKLMARDITLDAQHIDIALKRGKPLFEVQHCGCTLEMTSFKPHAEQALKKTLNGKLFIINGDKKRLIRYKVNGRTINVNPPQLG